MSRVINKFCFCGSRLSANRYTFCSKHRATNLINRGRDGTPTYKERLPKCVVCDKKLSTMASKYCHRHVKVSDATRQKISTANKRRGAKPPVHIGEDNPRWRGGITNTNLIIRNSAEMKRWRTAVFERDDHTCQSCGVRGGKLNADHELPFALFPDLRFELLNGRTLCVSCHQKTDTHGIHIEKLRAIHLIN